MPEVSFHPPDYYPECGYKFVIIGARHLGRWVFIKHKRRRGYELPAGHIKRGENPDEAAGRELMEETGAVSYTIACISTYTVHDDNGLRAGRLYYADIEDIGPDYDKDEVDEVIMSDSLPTVLSFPYVQKILFNYLQEYLNDQINSN